ncbi:hypothetical protein [Weissella confusa]|uniref:hypothetical protein n=1 Tax=Weissella confusa TaxID=1583 RepID=UPI0017858CF2|nr:hypothetical protein [Weissella confusa]MBD5834153.1 hypothetical protein [Weissella confusa]
MTTLRDLLINKDSVLILNLDLVDKIGLNEAIFLQQLHYWIEIKQRSAQAGELVNGFADGRFWVYKTLNPIAKTKAQRMAENGRRVITSWSEDFSFWSSRTVQRTINSLVESGFVLKGNFNKMEMDKTVWLTIDYERLSEEIADKARSDAYGQNVQMGNDAYGQNVQMDNGAYGQNVQMDNNTYGQIDQMHVDKMSIAIPEITKPEITNIDWPSNFYKDEEEDKENAHANSMGDLVANEKINQIISTEPWIQSSPAWKYLFDWRIENPEGTLNLINSLVNSHWRLRRANDEGYSRVSTLGTDMSLNLAFDKAKTVADTNVVDSKKYFDYLTQGITMQVDKILLGSTVG